MLLSKLVNRFSYLLAETVNTVTSTAKVNRRWTMSVEAATLSYVATASLLLPDHLSRPSDSSTAMEIRSNFYSLLLSKLREDGKTSETSALESTLQMLMATTNCECNTMLLSSESIGKVVFSFAATELLQMLPLLPKKSKLQEHYHQQHQHAYHSEKGAKIMQISDEGCVPEVFHKSQRYRTDEQVCRLLHTCAVAVNRVETALCMPVGRKKGSEEVLKQFNELGAAILKFAEPFDSKFLSVTSSVDLAAFVAETLDHRQIHGQPELWKAVGQKKKKKSAMQVFAESLTTGAISGCLVGPSLRAAQALTSVDAKLEALAIVSRFRALCSPAIAQEVLNWSQFLTFQTAATDMKCMGFKPTWERLLQLFEAQAAILRSFESNPKLVPALHARAVIFIEKPIAASLSVSSVPMKLQFFLRLFNALQHLSPGPYISLLLVERVMPSFSQFCDVIVVDANTRRSEHSIFSPQEMMFVAGRIASLHIEKAIKKKFFEKWHFALSTQLKKIVCDNAGAVGAIGLVELLEYSVVCVEMVVDPRNLLLYCLLGTHNSKQKTANFVSCGGESEALGLLAKVLMFYPHCDLLKLLVSLIGTGVSPDMHINSFLLLCKLFFRQFQPIARVEQGGEQQPKEEEDELQQQSNKVVRALYDNALAILEKGKCASLKEVGDVLERVALSFSEVVELEGDHYRSLVPYLNALTPRLAEYRRVSTLAHRNSVLTHYVRMHRDYPFVRLALK